MIEPFCPHSLRGLLRQYEHEVPRTVLLACKGWEAEQCAAA